MVLNSKLYGRQLREGLFPGYYYSYPMIGVGCGDLIQIILKKKNVADAGKIEQEP